MARSRPNRCQHALQRPPESHRMWPFIPIFVPIHKRTMQVQVHPFFRPNMDDASPSPSWITHHARASTRCACIPRCGIPGDAIPSTVPKHTLQVRRSVHGVRNARVFEARAASRGQSRSTSSPSPGPVSHIHVFVSPSPLRTYIETARPPVPRGAFRSPSSSHEARRCAIADRSAKKNEKCENTNVNPRG